MFINELIQNKNISKYRLSKNSGVPYTTITDICSGKARLEKCSAETIFKLAEALDITMEDLLEPYIVKRSNFELFKSNVCHRVKELGDINFVIEILENNDIRKYYQRRWYPECFYLLAMLDYISRINEIPLCTDYNDLRRCKLSEPIFPASVIVVSTVEKDNHSKETAIREAIPEFLRFNIVECEVRNVI